MNNELHKINLTGWVIGVSAFIVNVIIIFIIISSASDMSGETSNPVSDSEGFLMSTYTYDLPNGEKITSSSAKVYNQTWLNFDGVNDVVNLSDNDNFSPYLNNNITMFYIKYKVTDFPIGHVGIADKIIFAKASTDNNEYVLSVSNSSYNKTTFYVYNTIASKSQLTYLNTPQLGYNNFNNWIEGVIVFDGSYISTYFNGKATDRDIIYLNGSTSSSLILGQKELNWSNAHFNGSINKFEIYNNSMKPLQVLDFLDNKSLKGKQIYIPILMYHSIGGSSDVDINVNLTNFAAQMSWLNSSGYHTITDKEYYNWTQNLGFVMPSHPIIITFDDGYRNVYYNATPIMDNYGFKGVIALITSLVNTTSTYMNWTQVNELIVKGWSVASHSQYHCDLGYNDNMVLYCNDSTTRINNLSISKLDIIGNTSTTPVSFIYPFNDYGNKLPTGIDNNFVTYPEVMNNCSLNYSICFGDSREIRYSLATPMYITNKSGFFNGEVSRISIFNTTTLNEFDYALNYTNVNLILFNSWELNENSGTTVYDSSGNGNNGTISGATWQNDGVLVSLTDNVDFSINKVSGVVTLLNPVYLFSYITASWTESNIDDSVSMLRGNVSAGVDVISGKIPVLFLVLIVGVILIVLGGLTALFYLLMKKVPSRFSGGV